MQVAIHGAEVRVPALKGMTTADARSVASGLGLDLDVDNRYYFKLTSPQEAHFVAIAGCGNCGAARVARARGRRARGAQKVDVPDTVGANERVAGLELHGAPAFKWAKLRVCHLGPLQQGTVLAQDPPPHAQGIEQPSVSLLVAAPDDETPDGYVMPDLTGWQFASAEAALKKVGIKQPPPSFVDVPVALVGNGNAQPKASGAARREVAGAIAQRRLARGPEHLGETDRGEVGEQGRRNRMGLSEDLERIALQERELKLSRLDARVAWELGSKIRSMAMKRGLTLVVDVRRFGQPLFYAALEGTTPDNAEWVRRKSNVVGRFHRSSYGVGMTQKIEGDQHFLSARGCR